MVCNIIPKAIGKASREVNTGLSRSSDLNAQADVAQYLALLPLYQKDSKLLTDRLHLKQCKRCLGV